MSNDIGEKGLLNYYINDYAFTEFLKNIFVVKKRIS